ncbi:hypothetical protein KKB99_01590 [bacterium]|nr:hypothetical protein [bacterium]MBU1024679.1 hypothetical protein [bacterium]
MEIRQDFLKILIFYPQTLNPQTLNPHDLNTYDLNTYDLNTYDLNTYGNYLQILQRYYSVVENPYP